MIETINKFTHTYRRLTQELTREPLMEELATEMDMDIRKVRQIMRVHKVVKVLKPSPAKSLKVLMKKRMRTANPPSSVWER